MIRNRLILFLVIAGLVLLSLSQIMFKEVKLGKTTEISSTQSSVKPDFGKLPLYFIPNKGQVNEHVRFYVKTSGYSMWMTDDGMVFDIIGKKGRDISKVTFLNSNKKPEISPVKRTTHKVNYFIGNDPNKWKTGIETSLAVLAKNVYKNIDLKVYGVEKQMEYDWIVKPGADPTSIRMKYHSDTKARLDQKGNLVIKMKTGDMVQQKPFAYQLIDKKKIPVRSEFLKVDENQFSFRVGSYDRAHDLVIDPPVYFGYSTYIGGGNRDYGYGITVDSSGCAYVTGQTNSTDFPTTPSCYQPALNSGYDVFVTKFSATGNALIYSTYIGGSGTDRGFGIGVDNKSRAYITGDTNSINFPIQNAHQSSNGGGFDAFLFRLYSTGGLSFSTYFGGSNDDNSRSIAVDSDGNIVFTGKTASSTNFPISAGSPTWGGGTTDAFAVKFSGYSFKFSRLIGGNGDDEGYGIALDYWGRIYVTGSTTSSDFPRRGGYQNTYGGNGDAFVTKIQSTGDDVLYSTYLGGTNTDAGYGITVDIGPNIYVTGQTASTDFPTINPAQSTFNGSTDAFVTKIHKTGTSLVYSTFLGGTYYESGNGIVVDANGYAYVVGKTNSSNFTTVNPVQGTLAGNYDAFATKLSKGGNTLIYSTFLGGYASDIANGAALDGNNCLYVTGSTASSDFPTYSPYHSSNYGYYDSFVSKLCFSSNITAPIITLDKILLNFTRDIYGRITGPQQFLVRNTGQDTLNWTISCSAPWLNITPTSGTNCGLVTVSLGSLTGMVAGTYTTTIYVEDYNAINSPATVAVTLRIYSSTTPPDSIPPFGFVDSPITETIVEGVVPFSGWALDDIEVTHVYIIEGENTVGEANFVEGARGDIAQTYPNYPFYTRAGWGYLLLSNFYTDGAHTFGVVAIDKEGNSVSLGTRTLIINNTNASLPFGTLDVPVLGGIYEKKYYFYGWALTPLNKTILSNGVQIYVDSVYIGLADYGAYREDICTLLPSYNNSCSASFNYCFDSNGYTNGMHSVYANVTDNASVSNAVGSRYFQIINTGSLNSFPYSGQVPVIPISFTKISDIPEDKSTPVKLEKGFKGNSTEETLNHDKNGNMIIKIKELDRVVIHMDSLIKGGVNGFDGYIKIGENLYPLPVGSTLDQEKGIFYWQPGPGFIGDYKLAFVANSTSGPVCKKHITVRITPKFSK